MLLLARTYTYRLFKKDFTDKQICEMARWPVMYTISPKKSVETSAGLFCPVHEILSCNVKNQVPLMAVVDKAEDKEMDQIDHSY